MRRTTGPAGPLVVCLRQQHARRRLRRHRATVPGPARCRLGPRGGRGEPLHHGGRPEGRTDRGTDRRGLPALRDHPGTVTGPPDRDRIESRWPPHRGRALLGRPGRAAVLGPGARPAPSCCPACRPMPPWPSSTASSGRPSTPSAPASFPSRCSPSAGRRPRLARRPPAFAAQHRRARRGAGRRLRGGHSESDAVGWSVITRADGGTEVVLVQGHPEYDPSSLLREYHRDARRYVLASGTMSPASPSLRGPWRLGAAPPPARADRRGERARGSSSRSPSTRWGPGPTGRGGTTAIRLYTNWMAGVKKRSS